jgi:hypothetical protein
MTWTLSISCLSSVVDFEENLFEAHHKNAPDANPRAIIKMSVFAVGVSNNLVGIA